VDPTRPKQASLRRSISTTYYALFHLLTGAAASNWKNRDQRLTFERAFDHGKMARVSGRISGQPFPNQDPQQVRHLRIVARAFAHLQELRHGADYDGNRIWVRVDALESNALARQAFRSWKSVSKEKIAQDCLLQFLVQR
jgi:hypothetical protein